MGYVSPENKLRKIAAGTDLSDGKAVEKTYNALLLKNPKAAVAWLKSVTPMLKENIRQQKLSQVGTAEKSNLGKYYDDAMAIFNCQPGPGMAACRQKAMDYVMQFKKPEGALQGGLGKGAADRVWDGFKKAENSQTNLLSIKSALQGLDAGITAGTFAEGRQWANNFLYTMGLSSDPKTINTQKFVADTARLVGGLLASGMLGAGTGLSDNDVLFAKSMVGADLNSQPEAMRRILEMAQTANTILINKHNSWAGSINPETLRRGEMGDMSFIVPIPEPYKPKAFGVDPASNGDFSSDNTKVVPYTGKK